MNRSISSISFFSFFLPSKSLIFQLKIWLFQSTYCFGVLGRFGLWDFIIGVRFHLLELRIHLFIRSLFLAAHLIEFGDLISALIRLILFFVFNFQICSFRAFVGVSRDLATRSWSARNPISFGIRFWAFWVFLVDF